MVLIPAHKRQIHTGVVLVKWEFKERHRSRGVLVRPCQTHGSLLLSKGGSKDGAILLGVLAPGYTNNRGFLFCPEE